jgi:hypothetical protein
MTLMFLLLLVALTQQPKTAQPNLKETLTWMHNFAADNANQIVGQSSTDNQRCELGTPNCQDRRDETTFDGESCDATIKWTITFDYQNHGTYTYRVSLKNLDPNSVTIVKDLPFEIAVHSETTNSAKLVAQTFSPPMGKQSILDTPSTQTWVELVFADKDHANRFAKALRRAIHLCGGKPSAF